MTSPRALDARLTGGEPVQPPLARAGAGVGRGLHGQPRPVHRQHRLPRHRARLSRQLGLGLSWVLNAYAIVFAALLVPAGRLADRYGRKAGFIVGLGVFALGSALCGAAPSVAVAGGRPRAAGRRRGAAAADLAGAAAARVHAGAAPGGDRRLGWGRRRRRGRRSAAGRRARAGLLAACVPGQYPGRARRAACSLRACCARPATAPSGCPTCPAPACFASVRRARARPRQGPRVGLGRAPHAARSSARGRAGRCSWPARRPPLAGGRPVDAARPLLRAGQRRDVAVLRSPSP